MKILLHVIHVILMEFFVNIVDGGRLVQSFPAESDYLVNYMTPYGLVEFPDDVRIQWLYSQGVADNGNIQIFITESEPIKDRYKRFLGHATPEPEVSIIPVAEGTIAHFERSDTPSRESRTPSPAMTMDMYKYYEYYVDRLEKTDMMDWVVGNTIPTNKEPTMIEKIKNKILSVYETFMAPLPQIPETPLRRSKRVHKMPDRYIP